MKITLESDIEDSIDLDYLDPKSVFLYLEFDDPSEDEFTSFTFTPEIYV